MFGIAGSSAMTPSGDVWASDGNAGTVPVVARAGTLAPTLSGVVALPGSAAKNSFASRAITAGSGSGNIARNPLSSASAAEPRSAVRSADVCLLVPGSLVPGSLVLMILIHADAFENAHSIFRENGQRAVQRDQVGRDGLVIDAHEAHRKAGRNFTRDPGLEQPDRALLLFTRPQQQNICLVCLYGDFVGRHQRQSPPRQKWIAEYGHRRRRHPATRALAPEGGNGTGMRQKERRFLPDSRNQFVQVIRSGRALPRFDL